MSSSDFLLLMISLPQEINVWKKKKNQVFAALSFQGLCSTLTFREANHFSLAISEEIHKKHLSAGLQMLLLLLQGPRAAQIVTLNWGN